MSETEHEDKIGAEENLEESDAKNLEKDNSEAPTVKRSRKNRITLALSPLALFAVLGGAILGSTGGAVIGVLALDGATKRIANSGEIVITDASNLTWASAAAKKVSPSTVALLASSQSNVTTGSGFVFDEEGHIITSAHVVNHANVNLDAIEIQLQTWDGDIYPASIVGLDLDTDIAVLKVGGDYVNGELKPVSWGDSGKVNSGDPVIALGAPFDLFNTITSGIVSNPDRVIQLTSQKQEQKISNQMEFFGEGLPVENSLTVRVIQADVPINPGNSGGPLANAEGEVIGLVAAIAGGEYATGLSFSLQGNNVQRIVKDIIKTGGPNNGLLGIIVTSAPPAWFDVESSSPTLFEGARIVEVADGSAASQAGLLPDDVIIAVDATKIMTSVGLSSYVGSRSPGTEIEITYRRDGIETTTTAALGSRN